MRLISVRELGSDRPWYRFGVTDTGRVWEFVGEAIELQERNPALQYVQMYHNGPWLPFEDEPTEQDILARMVAKLDTGAANARLDAVDELIELGRTTPEAWKLVFEAMPVEAEDKLERAVG